jgi:hypothetical protein
MSNVGRLVVAGLLLIAWPATAADSPVGTWVKKKVEPGKPGMIFKIEKWGSDGAKLTWELKEAKMVMTLATKLDGKDAPLLMNGKPSGETMAITRVDKLHSTTILKMNGKQFGTSKGTFSADFNTMTVDNDISQAVGGSEMGKTTEVWTRQ